MQRQLHHQEDLSREFLLRRPQGPGKMRKYQMSGVPFSCRYALWMKHEPCMTLRHRQCASLESETAVRLILAGNRPDKRPLSLAERLNTADATWFTREWVAQRQLSHRAKRRTPRRTLAMQILATASALSTAKWQDSLRSMHLLSGYAISGICPPRYCSTNISFERPLWHSFSPGQ